MNEQKFKEISVSAYKISSQTFPIKSGSTSFPSGLILIQSYICKWEIIDIFDHVLVA